MVGKVSLQPRLLMLRPMPGWLLQYPFSSMLHLPTCRTATYAAAPLPPPYSGVVSDPLTNLISVSPPRGASRQPIGDLTTALKRIAILYHMASTRSSSLPSFWPSLPVFHSIPCPAVGILRPSVTSLNLRGPQCQLFKQSMATSRAGTNHINMTWLSVVGEHVREAENLRG